MCFSPSSCLHSHSIISTLLLWFCPFLWSNGPFLPATPTPVVFLASLLLRSPCQSPLGPIRAQPHLANQRIKKEAKVCFCVCCQICVYACLYDSMSVCLFAWICRIVLCVCLRMYWCRLGERALNSSSSLSCRCGKFQKLPFIQVLRPLQLRWLLFQPIKLQSHQADFRAAAAPPRPTTSRRPILLLPTNSSSDVGKIKALPITDEKRRSPSNILSSSVGDGGGDCETQSPNQWDIDTADTQPVSLGGRRFMSACMFLQFKTEMSHIFYLVFH